MSDLFKNVVGQKGAKRTLTQMIENYRRSRYFPSTLSIAPKGQGKTTLAIETARNLWKFDELGNPEINAATGRPRIKPLVKVNCASLKSVKTFINEFVIRHIQDKDVTVLFDEAGEIPHKVSQAMLDIFNTSGADTNYKTTYQEGEYFCEFDFRRQTFLFCTSESHKVFHSLADRLKKLTLSDYSPSEIQEIFKLNLPEVEFEDGVLDDVASVSRGNARHIKQVAIDCYDFLQGSKVFMAEDWDRFKYIYNVAPLGLNELEIAILRHLSGNARGTSLFRLSAKTGMTREQLQRDGEMFLHKHELMEVGTAGRQITAKGLQYLKDYDVLLEDLAKKYPEDEIVIPMSHQLIAPSVIKTEVTVDPEPVL